MQPILFLFWYIIVPLSSYIMGYFPANIFGLGEKLPCEVGNDWARMARSRYSVLSMYRGTENDHFEQFKGSFTLYTYSDDHLIPKRAGDELLTYYLNAQNKQHRRINPADLGEKAIGHLGFFRAKMRDTLWQETADWLLEPQSQSHLQAESMPHLRTNEATQTG
jgi:predicted alpha/beta hydrolase